MPAAQPANTHALGDLSPAGRTGRAKLAAGRAGYLPRSESSSPARSSGRTSTSLALDPSLGPTTPRLSSRSISRPALANPTRSLRWSIDVEPRSEEHTSELQSPVHLVCR